MPNKKTKYVRMSCYGCGCQQTYFTKNGCMDCGTVWSSSGAVSGGNHGLSGGGVVPPLSSPLALASTTCNDSADTSRRADGKPSNPASSFQDTDGKWYDVGTLKQANKYFETFFGVAHPAVQ
jgi:hypothetical protein